jgi:hypothetical protein
MSVAGRRDDTCAEVCADPWSAEACRAREALSQQKELNLVQEDTPALLPLSYPGFMLQRQEQYLL